MSLPPQEFGKVLRCGNPEEMLAAVPWASGLQEKAIQSAFLEARPDSRQMFEFAKAARDPDLPRLYEQALSASRDNAERWRVEQDFQGAFGLDVLAGERPCRKSLTDLHGSIESIVSSGTPLECYYAARFSPASEDQRDRLITRVVQSGDPVLSYLTRINVPESAGFHDGLEKNILESGDGLLIGLYAVRVPEAGSDAVTTAYESMGSGHRETFDMVKSIIGPERAAELVEAPEVTEDGVGLRLSA